MIVYAIARFIPLLIPLVIMGAISAYLRTTLLPQIQNEGAKSRVMKIIGNADIYPIMMMISWIPNLIAFMYGFVIVVNLDTISRGQTEDYVLGLSYTYLFGNCYGLLLAIGFFVKSAQARKLWYRWLFPLSVDEQNKLVDKMVNLSHRSTTVDTRPDSTPSHSHNDRDRYVNVFTSPC